MKDFECQHHFILDTNALIYNPHCCTSEEFNHAHLHIPEIVLNELERFKKEDTARGFAAREVARTLRDYRNLGNLTQGIQIDAEHFISVDKMLINENDKPLIDGWDLHDPDHVILKVAKQLQSKFTRNGNQMVTLVTNDMFLAIKADTCRIPVREPLCDQSSEYTGQADVCCLNSTIFGRDQNWQISPQEICTLNNQSQPESIPSSQLHLNEFFILRNQSNPQLYKLGRLNDQGFIVPLQHEQEKPQGISARSIGQKFLMEALYTRPGESRLILAEGPAGCGKTLLTLAVGITQKQAGQFRRFYFSRANVEADKDYGFVPGTIEDKFDQFLNPIYDNLEELIAITKKSNNKHQRSRAEEDDEEDLSLTNKKTSEEKLTVLDAFGIEAKTLNHMRGRSLQRRFIFVDEAQNLAREQAKMIVTRAGKGTVVVLAGDVSQIDAPNLNRFNNGLTHAIKTMADINVCYRLRLQSIDNQRNLLSRLASERM